MLLNLRAPGAPPSAYEMFMVHEKWAVNGRILCGWAVP